MDSQPWPANYIHVRTPAKAIVDLLEDEIIAAHDETGLQILLRDHPELLTVFMPSCTDRWFWDRPKFGNQFIPDFLLCYRNSQGFNWVMVELESPTQNPLTQKGLVAKKLNEAIGQIRNWKIWLRQNIAYSAQQLGFRELDAECESLVLIGRRTMVAPTQAIIYRELSTRGEARVMSYDRLLEMARALQE